MDGTATPGGEAPLGGPGPGPASTWHGGRLLSDPLLAEAVASLENDTRRLAGLPLRRRRLRPAVDHAGAAARLAGSAELLFAVLCDPGEASALRTDAVALLAELRELERQLAAERRAIERRTLTLAAEAIRRLDTGGGMAELTVLIPAEVCRCGFDRAVLTRLDGTVATLESHSVSRGAELGPPGPVARARRADVDLDRFPRETAMTRRRRPLLVRDATVEAVAVWRFPTAPASRSYVAAPVISRDAVVGLLHADCAVQRRLADELDRDVVALLAAAVGHLLERTALGEVNRVLRDGARRTRSAVAAVLTEDAGRPVALAEAGIGDEIARSAAHLFLAEEERLEAQLTGRELEVLELMAAGEPTSGIAAALVVTDATVKFHVKRILRKLRAKNRADAVARYVRFSQPHTGAP